MTRSRKVSYATLIILLVLASSLVFVSSSVARKGLLTVSVLNIGQGDAIFIQAPNGAQFVVDGGPDNRLLGELGRIMSFFDRNIDGIMITNPDKDHYAGFLSLISRYKVGQVVEAGTKSDTSTYAALQEAIEELKIPKTIAKRGMKIVLDQESEVYLEILFPDRDVSTLSTNDGSIIAKLVYGNTSMMLQGDAPDKIEQYLLSLDRGELDADILKTGHHGSRTSTSESYVRAVSPDYAVISSGRDNSYGHPHKEVLDTLSSLNIPILRTDQGRVTFVSDGNKFVSK